MSSKFSFPLVVATILVLLICFSDLCWSDTFQLKNGNRLEGIIIKETPNSFTVRVKFGTVGIRKENIEHFKRATLDENKALQQKWEEEEEKREEERKLAILKEKEEQWKREEKERKEKEGETFYKEVLGWKKHQDKWLPPKLADLLTLKDNLFEEEQNSNKKIAKQSKKRKELKNELRIIRKNQKEIEELAIKLDYEESKSTSDRYKRKVFTYSKKVVKLRDKIRKYSDKVDDYNEECQELINTEEALNKAWAKLDNFVNTYLEEEIHEDILRALQRSVEEFEKRKQERKKRLKDMEI